ncbi:hypothetical protein TRFO_20040 [Tritrichomonas foetus]|uniref:Uncharacterized protein n=1 Tax=Tritrichomonas foetus TaxID=1144522 RepID=A0A1J4KL91_9EUKA|nr:hypothetical protein TRFO_20040 [Tritrichomonas foetus]|eukprot:OHT10556.1 hypothetical protein TRFO_20040 [Tritrichomonas foetus]
MPKHIQMQNQSQRNSLIDIVLKNGIVAAQIPINICFIRNYDNFSFRLTLTELNGIPVFSIQMKDTVVSNKDIFMAFDLFKGGLDALRMKDPTIPYITDKTPLSFFQINLCVKAIDLIEAMY